MERNIVNGNNTLSRPVTAITPRDMDVGTIVSGEKMFVAAQKHSDIQTSVFNKGKYISFVNEEIRGSGAYISPANLKESMHIIGKWAENDGYPSSAAVQIP